MRNDWTAIKNCGPQSVFYSVAKERRGKGKCAFDLRAAKFMNPSSTGRIYRILNVVVSHIRSHVSVYEMFRCGWFKSLCQIGCCVSFYRACVFLFDVVRKSFQPKCSCRCDSIINLNIIASWLQADEMHIEAKYNAYVRWEAFLFIWCIRPLILHHSRNYSIFANKMKHFRYSQATAERTMLKCYRQLLCLTIEAMNLGSMLKPNQA